jgi:hypothetical protein
VLERVDALAHAGLGIVLDVVEHGYHPGNVQADEYSRGVKGEEFRRNLFFGTTSSDP